MAVNVPFLKLCLKIQYLIRFIQIRAYSCFNLNVLYIGLLRDYLVVKGCIKVLYEAKYAGSESFESM